MKTILLSVLLSLFSVSAFAEVSCSTVGATSCKTAEGMCFEYPADSVLNASQVESMCQGMPGVFSNSPCPAEFNKGKCVSNASPYISILLFDSNFDLDSISFVCTSMNAELCN